MDLRAATAAELELLKDLFGNPTRWLLLMWVLAQGSEAFMQADAIGAVERMGGHRSTAATQLDRVLVAHGLVTRSDPTAGERRVLYGANKEHPLWPGVAEVMTALGFV